MPRGVISLSAEPGVSAWLRDRPHDRPITRRRPDLTPSVTCYRVLTVAGRSRAVITRNGSADLQRHARNTSELNSEGPPPGHPHFGAPGGGRSGPGAWVRPRLPPTRCGPKAVGYRDVRMLVALSSAPNMSASTPLAAASRAECSRLSWNGKLRVRVPPADRPWLNAQSGRSREGASGGNPTPVSPLPGCLVRRPPAPSRAAYRVTTPPDHRSAVVTPGAGSEVLLAKGTPS